MSEDDNFSRGLRIKEQGQRSINKYENGNFLSFKGAYLEQLERIQTLLTSVYRQDSLDIDEMYDAVASLFKSLNGQHNMILYLNAIYTTSYFVYEHLIRVSLIAHLFASWLKLDEEQTKGLTISGLLHDIGMQQVPKALIEKKEKLTEDEFRILQGHTQGGMMILVNRGISKEIREAVLSHHERFDGSGYPSKKTGDQVGLYAKAIGIIDAYDAMTSFRSYSEAQCPFTVIEHFEREMVGKFDPELLYIFLENIPHIYRDCLVELSDGEQGRIVFINKHFKTSPIIQLEKDSSFVDLSIKKDLKIVKLL